MWVDRGDVDYTERRLLPGYMGISGVLYKLDPAITTATVWVNE